MGLTSHVPRIVNLPSTVTLAVLLFAGGGVPSDHKLVPGVRVDWLRLGASADEAWKRLPQLGYHEGPKSDAAMGHFWRQFLDFKHLEIDLYSVRGPDDRRGHPQNSIRQIRVTSPAFFTSNGIHTGSTLTDIRKAFPHAKKLKAPGPGELWDEVAKGIAFDCKPLRGVISCVAITIHRKRTQVTGEYLSFTTIE